MGTGEADGGLELELKEDRKEFLGKVDNRRQ